MPPRKIYGRDPDVTVERAMWSLSRLLGSQGGRTRSASPVPKKGPTSSVEPADVTPGSQTWQQFYHNNYTLSTATGDFPALYDSGDSGATALLDFSTDNPTVIDDGFYFISVMVSLLPGSNETWMFSTVQVYGGLPIFSSPSVLASDSGSGTNWTNGVLPHFGTIGTNPGMTASGMAPLSAGDAISVYIENNSSFTATYAINGQIVRLS